MKSDEQIRQDVERELRWCSGIDATAVADDIRVRLPDCSGLTDPVKDELTARG